MSAANTIFVEGAVEAQIIEIASYIATLQGDENETPAYVSDISTKLEAGKKDEVLNQLVKDSSILLSAPVKVEAEGALNLVIAILQSNTESIKPFINTLVAEESDRYNIKQKILLNLYNTCPTDSRLRYDAFVAIFDIAVKNDDLEPIVSQLDYVDVWAKEWALDLETERAFYTHLVQSLKSAGEERAAFDFSLKNLATYNDSSDSASADLAKQAIFTAIQMPNCFAFEDLLQYKSLQQLKGTPEYELLNIFLNGNLQEYNKFAAEHKDLLANFDVERNITKMRLLSLASLGSENLARELTYSEIAAALEIPQEEVEMWVIDVIRAGLVEAKLDQLNKTVIVYRSIYRVFGKEQWQQLDSKLSSWKNSLNDILAVIGNAKLIAGNASQTGGAAVVIESNAATTSTPVKGSS
ncbi:hypothetical protein INT43_001140 [Umbelopsis isabellina]|uniref:Eukaryotic translation initiation factor 3 subunit M n=1 Tax=Mortierella isabellina TaxID=91625 RepID=A0A8H7UD36_MORIS|nr:hypothetical protein INT43_001140 [Umbelopsis isabellina]